MLRWQKKIHRLNFSGSKRCVRRFNSTVVGRVLTHPRSVISDPLNISTRARKKRREKQFNFNFSSLSSSFNFTGFSGWICECIFGCFSQFVFFSLFVRGSSSPEARNEKFSRTNSADLMALENFHNFAHYFMNVNDRHSHDSAGSVFLLTQRNAWFER